MSFEGNHGKYKYQTEVSVAQPESDQTRVENPELDENQDDVALDSIEAVDAFHAEVETSVTERLQAADTAIAEHSVLSGQLQEFTEYLESVRVKLRGGFALSELDQAHVQEIYERLMDEVDGLTETVEETPFDPESYIHEQFAEHPYLTASKRQSAYSLLREYKRALKETGDQEAQELAAQLALEIQELVDELVGNDLLPEEGQGSDLTKRKVGTKLTLTSLDEELPTVAKEHTSETTNDQDSQSIAGHDYVDLPQAQAESVQPALEPEPIAEVVAMQPAKQAEVTPKKLGFFKKLTSRFTRNREADNPNYKRHLAEVAHAAEVAQDVADLRAMAARRAEAQRPSPLMLTQDMRLPNELSPEEQLQQVMAENGQDSLEWVANKENFAPFEPHKTETTPQFTPTSVQEKSWLSRAEQIDSRQAQLQLLRAVGNVEAIPTGWFASNLDAGQSPYQVLGNDSFEDLATYAQSNETRTECRAWLKSNGIDEHAFFNWMDLLPEMQARGVQTDGQSFKQVIDTLLELRAAEQRNTQPTAE
jgi:hypothetical protein